MFCNSWLYSGPLLYIWMLPLRHKTVVVLKYIIQQEFSWWKKKNHRTHYFFLYFILVNFNKAPNKWDVFTVPLCRDTVHLWGGQTPHSRMTFLWPAGTSQARGVTLLAWDRGWGWKQVHTQGCGTERTWFCSTSWSVGTIKSWLQGGWS